MTACMGGWCHKRGACAHYTCPAGEPVERLCPPGSLEHFAPPTPTNPQLCAPKEGQDTEGQ